jgi:hypothetical protein
VDSAACFEGVQTKGYRIAPQAWSYRAVVPAGWQPDLSLPLDEAIPHAWAEKYIRIYKQPFTPNRFMRNAVAVADYFAATSDQRAMELQRRLLDRLLEFSAEAGGARFLLYKFQKSYRGKPLPNPWTSGYASGAALISLTSMMAMGVEGAAIVAGEILEGLARPVRHDGDRSGYWVSLIDAGNFLWFEEAPLAKGAPSHILNGHIRAVLGLYAYREATGSELATALLNAGIATLEANSPRFMEPGKINRYDLLEPYMPDYSPERTWSQQHLLFKITGEPIFARYRDEFREHTHRDPAFKPASDGG